MSYIDKNLLVNEKILYRTRKSFIIFLAPLFWTLAALFFFTHDSNIFFQKIVYLLGAIAIGFWLNQLLLYTFSEFAITNKRVIMREGFLYRHVNETRLSAIANVSVNQSLLGQVCRYGAICINSFGGENDLFTELDSPVEFKKQLQELLYSLEGSRPAAI